MQLSLAGLAGMFILVLILMKKKEKVRIRRRRHDAKVGVSSKQVQPVSNWFRSISNTHTHANHKRDNRQNLV